MVFVIFKGNIMLYFFTTIFGLILDIIISPTGILNAFNFEGVRITYINFRNWKGMI